MGKEKILVAMSGGIDSSMAAQRLLQAGYEVVGVTMRLFDEPAATPANGQAACCSRRHYQDARDVAAALGIRHYLVNYRDDFRQRVITPFVETYLKGLTPSPCILCNTLIKFSKLRHFADCLGIRRVATGHYARVQFDEITRRHLLLPGAGRAEGPVVLPLRTGTGAAPERGAPLGDLTKRAIREQAAAAGLPVADKAESQEICFHADSATTRDSSTGTSTRRSWTTPPRRETSSSRTARWCRHEESITTRWASAGGWASPSATPPT